MGTAPRAGDEPPDLDNFNPETDDPDWPGQLYSAGRGGGANGVTINIRYDQYPEETMWAWEKLTTPSDSATIDSGKPIALSEPQNMTTPKREWEKLDSKPDVGRAKELLSYDEDVEPSTLYRFLVSDSSQDGSCCSWGPGFFTITNSSSVVWKMTGSDFTTNMEAYIWINDKGESQPARHVPGLGYVVVQHDVGDGGGSGMLEIVVRDGS